MVVVSVARLPPILVSPIRFRTTATRRRLLPSSALRLTRPLSSSCSASPLAVVASMETPPENYRTNVGICLADPSLTKIFTASRIDIANTWQMPQGGIDAGEDPREAAFRELREETGVTSAEMVAEVSYWPFAHSQTSSVSRKRLLIACKPAASLLILRVYDTCLS
jgi:hypothetical protein